MKIPDDLHADIYNDNNVGTNIHINTDSNVHIDTEVSVDIVIVFDIHTDINI